VARLRWAPEALDQVIVSAARGDLDPVAVLSVATGGVFAPYDGGADLFVAEPASVPTLHRKLARWASRLPSGL
jgi:hypothetical protein